MRYGLSVVSFASLLLHPCAVVLCEGETQGLMVGKIEDIYSTTPSPSVIPDMSEVPKIAEHVQPAAVQFRIPSPFVWDYVDEIIFPAKETITWLDPPEVSITNAVTGASCAVGERVESDHICSRCVFHTTPAPSSDARGG